MHTSSLQGPSPVGGDVVAREVHEPSRPFREAWDAGDFTEDSAGAVTRQALEDPPSALRKLVCKHADTCSFLCKAKSTPAHPTAQVEYMHHGAKLWVRSREAALAVLTDEVVAWDPKVQDSLHTRPTVLGVLVNADTCTCVGECIPSLPAWVSSNL